MLQIVINALYRNADESGKVMDSHPESNNHHNLVTSRRSPLSQAYQNFGRRP